MRPIVQDIGAQGTKRSLASRSPRPLGSAALEWLRPGPRISRARARKPHSGSRCSSGDRAPPFSSIVGSSPGVRPRPKRPSSKIHPRTTCTIISSTASVSRGWVGCPGRDRGCCLGGRPRPCGRPTGSVFNTLAPRCPLTGAANHPGARWPGPRVPDWRPHLPCRGTRRTESKTWVAQVPPTHTSAGRPGRAEVLGTWASSSQSLATCGRSHSEQSRSQLSRLCQIDTLSLGSMARASRQLPRCGSKTAPQHGNPCR